MHLQPNVASNLILCAIQVSLISLATIVVYLIVRRAALRTSKPLLLAGLGLVTLATLAIWLPLPSWFDRNTEAPDARFATAEALQTKLDAAAATDDESSELSEIDNEQVTAIASSTQPVEIDDPTAAEVGWGTYLSSAVERASDETVGSHAWRFYVVTGYLLFVAVASLKLLASWIWLTMHSRRSRMVQSGRAREVLDALCSELKCQRHVELRESPRLNSPAACGWRRPQILLPRDWQSWTAPQTRAILAHELTHIQQRDFESTLFAQFTLVLHFFNPLVHWLVAALRMEQEYEADRIGATFADDQQGYLSTLANMALQNHQRRIGLASPFLPNRDSFFRRIEMLKKNRQSTQSTSTSFLAGTAKSLVALPILIASIAVLGLRLPNTAFADETKNRTPFETRYVSAENGMVVALRPKAIFELPGFDQIAELFKGQLGPLENSPVEPAEIERLIIASSYREVEIPEKYQREGRPKTMSVPDKTAMYIRTSSEMEANAFDPMFPMYRFAQDGSDQTHRGKTYRTVEYKQNFFGKAGKEMVNQMARWQPSGKSVVVATDEQVKQIIGGKSKTPDTLNSPNWKAINRSMFAMAMDSSMVENMRSGPAQNADRDPMAKLTVEVLKDVESVYANIDVPDDIQAKVILVCKTKAGATTSAKMLREMLTLGRGMLAIQKADGFQGQMIKFGKKVLGEVKVGAKGREVHISLKTDYDDFVLGPLFEGVTEAKGAVGRARSKNNMKQMGLAFHNAAMATNKLPTAVVIGPNGHPHSWRVAMLAYTEEAELFNAYRFEEAWDSPHNKQFIEKMPAMYRHPDDPADSTSSRYYTFVGPGTIMGGDGARELKDIRDGTSKTILYVEAKRDFPWTKPEDIAYDPDGLPDVSDKGFLATYADASVRAIDDTVDALELHKLIQIDDEAKASAANPDAPRSTDVPAGFDQPLDQINE